jgi:hypothetical protein
VDDGDATAVDVACNFKMAEYFEAVVLEGKVIGGGKMGWRGICFLFDILSRIILRAM